MRHDVFVTPSNFRFLRDVGTDLYFVVHRNGRGESVHVYNKPTRYIDARSNNQLFFIVLIFFRLNFSSDFSKEKTKCS